MSKTTFIIGAGVSGLSVALQLIDRGFSVGLLERGTSGAESSWAGGGILSPLLPWDYSTPVNKLALRSAAAYLEWIQRIERYSGLQAEYWQCGMNVLDTSQNDIERASRWCHESSLPFEINRSTIRLPSIAQVRNPRLLAAAKESILQQGGKIFENSKEINLHVHNRQVTDLTVDGVKYPAKDIVIATGAWAGLPLAGVAPAPHIRPIRGQMLLFKLEPGYLTTVLYRHGLYLIPRLDGHVLAGSTLEDAGFDKSIDPPTRAHLHQEACKILPELSGCPVVHHWAGLRPGSPDNTPLIDQHPDFDNIFINVGHYRYGVTMAPASAELLADLMEGKTPALDPTPYSWAAAEKRRWTNRL
jgi:glycine oxidase